MEEDYSYKKEIKSNKNHLFALEIKIKENNLHFNSSFTENYITNNYLGRQIFFRRITKNFRLL